MIRLTLTGTPVEALVWMIVAVWLSLRIAVFIVNDSMFEGTRDRVKTWALKGSTLRGKLFDLLDCTWCVGVWVSVAVTCVLTGLWPWRLGVDGWAVAGAVAGLQGWLCSHVGGGDD